MDHFTEKLAQWLLLWVDAPLELVVDFWCQLLDEQRNVKEADEFLDCVEKDDVLSPECVPGERRVELKEVGKKRVEVFLVSFVVLGKKLQDDLLLRLS